MAGDFSAIEGASLCLLPERLDTAAAPALKALLEQSKAQGDGGVLQLDATQVTYVGGLCLQILLASQCSFVGVSEAVREAYGLFGVNAYLTAPCAVLEKKA